MPVSPLVRLITLPTSGTVTIDVSEQNTLFVITGNITLAGDLTIQSSGTPYSALQIFMTYKAVVNTNSHNLTIFDEVFSTIQATVKQTIVATYHNGAWDVDTAPDASEDQWLETHMVVDKAITNAKLADMLRGTVKVGDATNRPSDLDGKTNGNVLIGDGLDITSQPLGIAVSNIFASLVVKAATLVALPAFTYNNGAGGVGATITINANGVAPAIDGVTSFVGMRFLNKDSIDQRYNGIYSWTDVGSVSSQAIATRTTDSDQTGELDPQIVTPTDGTQHDKPFTQQTDLPVIGTDDIVYIFGLSKVNNWRLNGNSLTALKWIGTKTNFDFPIRTNNVEKARVFTTGELGIGITASPLGKLHVKGVTSNDSASALYVENSGSPTHSFQWRNDGILLRDTFFYSLFDNVNANTTWGKNAASAIAGANNIALFGHTAGESITTASSVSLFGSGAGKALLTANSNSFFGTNAGLLTTDGANNVFFGVNTGGTNVHGFSLTILGTGADVSTDSLGQSIGLGQSALVTASNQLVIGASGAVINQEQHYWSAAGIHGVYYRTTTPEGAQAAQRGSIAYVDDGANGALYLKKTGTGNTGWVAVCLAPCGSAGSFVTTDGTTTGATSQIQQFTNGIKTVAQDAIEIQPYGIGGDKTSELRFYESTIAQTGYVALKAFYNMGNAVTVYTLPSTFPSITPSVLLSDTSGIMQWAVYPDAAGSDGYVQFKNAGFGGNPDFFWDNSNEQLLLKNSSGITNPSYSFVDAPAVGMYWDSVVLGITTNTGVLQVESATVNLHCGVGSLKLTSGLAILGDAFGEENNITISVDGGGKTLNLNPQVGAGGNILVDSSPAFNGSLADAIAGGKNVIAGIIIN